MLGGQVSRLGRTIEVTQLNSILSAHIEALKVVKCQNRAQIHVDVVAVEPHLPRVSVCSRSMFR